MVRLDKPFSGTPSLLKFAADVEQACYRSVGGPSEPRRRAKKVAMAIACAVGAVTDSHANFQRQD